MNTDERAIISFLLKQALIRLELGDTGGQEIKTALKLLSRPSIMQTVCEGLKLAIELDERNG